MVDAISTKTLSEQAITALRAQLRGELIRPGGAHYDEARKVYNAMIDKRPALIARCADVADVISAVNFRPRERRARRYSGVVDTTVRAWVSWMAGSLSTSRG